MIVKKKGGYEVESEHSPHKNLGGPYPTKKQAKKRLGQVEYFKHKGADILDKLDRVAGRFGL